MAVASDGSKCFVRIRDNFGRRAEYKALGGDSQAVTRFIYEAPVTRYSCPALIVYFGRPESQGLTKQPFELYWIQCWLRVFVVVDKLQHCFPKYKFGFSKRLSPATCRCSPPHIL